MAKSQMVNFRAPVTSVDMYDEAAGSAGMTRSQWLRNAAELALARFRDSGNTPQAVEIKPKSGPACVEGNYKGCSKADWVKLPIGVRQCVVCGVKAK